MERELAALLHDPIRIEWDDPIPVKQVQTALPQAKPEPKPKPSPKPKPKLQVPSKLQPRGKPQAQPKPSAEKRSAAGVLPPEAASTSRIESILAKLDLLVQR